MTAPLRGGEGGRPVKKFGEGEGGNQPRKRRSKAI